MVTALGGLGNQLFQFGAAKSLQSDPSKPVVIDRRHDYAWRMSLGDVLRPDTFRYATPTELLRLGQIPRLPVLHRTVLRLQETGPVWPCRRSLVTDQDAIPTTRRSVLLRGYFQDERWLLRHRGHILDSFRPESGAATALVADSRRVAGHVVGVAIRSGTDYEGFGIRLPPGYYRQAAEAFRSTSPSFLVTGDVAEHCESVGRELETLGAVSFGYDLTPKQQLDALSLCDSLVISNSSFAWWAAWLGDSRRTSPDRVVVRPTPWVEGTPTTCPDRWLSLPSSPGGTWSSR